MKSKIAIGSGQHSGQGLYEATQSQLQFLQDMAHGFCIFSVRCAVGGRHRLVVSALSFVHDDVMTLAALGLVLNVKRRRFFS